MGHGKNKASDVIPVQTRYALDIREKFSQTNNRSSDEKSIYTAVIQRCAKNTLEYAF